jgi:hypothetical protein
MLPIVLKTCVQILPNLLQQIWELFLQNIPIFHLLYRAVIPASRVPFPLAVAMFANMLKVPLRQLVINRVQREKNRTRTAARLRTITSCHQVNCQLLAWLKGIMSGYISTGRGDANYMCDCWLRWGPYRDLIGLHGGCRGAGEGSW